VTHIHQFPDRNLYCADLLVCFINGDRHIVSHMLPIVPAVTIVSLQTEGRQDLR